jgi:hypothetical protein
MTPIRLITRRSEVRILPLREPRCGGVLRPCETAFTKACPERVPKGHAESHWSRAVSLAGRFMDHATSLLANVLALPPRSMLRAARRVVGEEVRYAFSDRFDERITYRKH